LCRRVWRLGLSFSLYLLQCPFRDLPDSWVLVLEQIPQGRNGFLGLCADRTQGDGCQSTNSRTVVPEGFLEARQRCLCFCSHLSKGKSGIEGRIAVRIPEGCSNKLRNGHLRTRKNFIS